MTKSEIVMTVVLFCSVIIYCALNTDTGASGAGIQEIPLWIN